MQCLNGFIVNVGIIPHDKSCFFCFRIKDVERLPRANGDFTIISSNGMRSYAPFCIGFQSLKTHTQDILSLRRESKSICFGQANMPVIQLPFQPTSAQAIHSPNGFKAIATRCHDTQRRRRKRWLDNRRITLSQCCPKTTNCKRSNEVSTFHDFTG